jgi:hypothetical protein
MTSRVVRTEGLGAMGVGLLGPFGGWTDSDPVVITYGREVGRDRFVRS